MENLKKALKMFDGKKILVIGDLILDQFITGSVSRISPEAPVPIVNVNNDKYLPGGAGNVAFNLRELGVDTTVIGAVGSDIFGEELLTILSNEGVSINGIHKDASRPTSIKTRVIAEHQQVVRIDREFSEEISEEVSNELSKKIVDELPSVDGVVISDYGKGLITKGIIANTIEACDEKIPVIVDPQVGHFFEYRGVTSITPNTKEASEALKISITDEDSLIKAGKKLLEMLECSSVLITRGEEGMSLFEKDTVNHIPTMAREVYDVTGAGDTVASVYILGLACGLNFYQSATLANYAAAAVIAKLGTATITREELINEMERNK